MKKYQRDRNWKNHLTLHNPPVNMSQVESIFMLGEWLNYESQPNV